MCVSAVSALTTFDKLEIQFSCTCRTHVPLDSLVVSIVAALYCSTNYPHRVILSLFLILEQKKPVLLL